MERCYSRLSTKDETVKTTQNYKNITIWSFLFGFCTQLGTLIVNLMINHWNKSVSVYKKPWKQGNWLNNNKFRTNVYEVSSFVGNPVYEQKLIKTLNYNSIPYLNSLNFTINQKINKINWICLKRVYIHRTYIRYKVSLETPN